MLTKEGPYRGIGGKRDQGWLCLYSREPTHGTLYIGSAVDLAQRVYDHKVKALPGFTSCYNVDRLVYYEHYPTISEARGREYQLKKWRRDWKLRLIEEVNPNWDDLYETLN